MSEQTKEAPTMNSPTPELSPTSKPTADATAISSDKPTIPAPEKTTISPNTKTTSGEKHTVTPVSSSRGKPSQQPPSYASVSGMPTFGSNVPSKKKIPKTKVGMGLAFAGMALNTTSGLVDGIMTNKRKNEVVSGMDGRMHSRQDGMTNRAQGRQETAMEFLTNTANIANGIIKSTRDFKEARYSAALETFSESLQLAANTRRLTVSSRAHNQASRQESLLSLFSL